MFNKEKLGRIILGLFIIVGLSACDQVPAGHVGIKVYLLGGDKGVDQEELGVGRYWIGINEDLYIFPTFTQNYVWTATTTEGSPNDESIQFQTVEGLTVGADIGISYSIRGDKVSTIFQKYRKGIDEITDIYLRNMVRDALVITGSTRNIESVYGAGKAEIIKEVENVVRSQVDKIGINIEKIYWIGSLRLPQSVVTALDAKIAATQKAQQRQNEVAQAKAEADKTIEEARGAAESKLVIARAEAEAIRMKGDALRRNPEVIKLNAIDRWNGELPKVSSGAVPFIDVEKYSK